VSPFGPDRDREQGERMRVINSPRPHAYRPRRVYRASGAFAGDRDELLPECGYVVNSNMNAPASGEEHCGRPEEWEGHRGRMCRFQGPRHNAEAVAVFDMPGGCVCFPEDRKQALCMQHVVKANPLAGMELREDLTEGGAFTRWWCLESTGELRRLEDLAFLAGEWGDE
jgi:hypothetical protein